jgi:hypothetical protein
MQEEDHDTKKAKKNKGEWDEEWTSSEDDDKDTSGGKMTFANCLTDSLNKVASAPHDKRRAVAATSAVRTRGSEVLESMGPQQLRNFQRCWVHECADVDSNKKRVSNMYSDDGFLRGGYRFPLNPFKQQYRIISEIISE